MRFYWIHLLLEISGLPTIEESQRANRENRLTRTPSNITKTKTTKAPVITTDKTKLDPGEDVKSPEGKLKVPPEKVIDDNPEPENNISKFPPIFPPPVRQNPPDKCKGSCPGKNGIKLDALTALLTGGNTASNLGILSIVRDTNNAIRHGTYGLENIQKFAQKAWETTGASKVLNLMGNVAALHNAAMLSQDALQSMGDVANSALNFFGIKSFDGTPIDVNEAIGGTIKDKLTSLFGASNLNSISDFWLSVNRIHQAVGSVSCAIQGTKNALLEADEITGGHIAEIGNALQEQGLVEEDTYDWMNTSPDYRQPFEGILGRIDAVEDVVNRVNSVVSTGLEIKESSNEVIVNSQELIDATAEFLTQKTSLENTKDAQSESPNIDRLDLIKHEPTS